MKISAVNFNLSPVIGKKYNNISFGSFANNDNHGDSFVPENSENNTEADKIKKYLELITPKGGKLKPDEAKIAVKKGYQGKTLADYVFAIHQGFDMYQAQTYAEYELSGFYSDYENEFKKNPYSKHSPIMLKAFMKKHKLTSTEALYPLGKDMDDETLKRYKIGLDILKRNNNGRLDKEDIKLAANAAINTANEYKEAERKKILNELISIHNIPQEFAELISQNPEFIQQVDVINSLLPENEDNEDYPIKPYKPISKQDMKKILSSRLIKNNFSKFAVLISVDKKTNEPVNRKKRALTLNEAYYFIANNIPKSALNLYIFYCDCGMNPSQAAKMLSDNGK